MCVKKSLLGPQVSLVTAVISHDISLPTDVLAALKAELAKSAYATLSIRQSFTLLNQRSSISNPVARGVNTRASCSLDEFSKFLVGPRTIAAMSSDATIVARWTAISDALMPVISNMISINLRSATLSQIMAHMVTDSLISTSDIAAFLDPAWQSTIIVCPADIVAPDYILSPYDIVEALAS